MGVKLKALPSMVTPKVLKSVTEGLLAKLTSLITAKLLPVEVGVPMAAAPLVRETSLMTRLEVAEVIVNWLSLDTVMLKSVEPLS